MLLERVRAGSEKAAELCPFPRSPGEGGEPRGAPRTHREPPGSPGSAHPRSNHGTRPGLAARSWGSSDGTGGAQLRRPPPPFHLGIPGGSQPPPPQDPVSVPGFLRFVLRCRRVRPGGAQRPRASQARRHETGGSLPALPPRRPPQPAPPPPAPSPSGKAPGNSSRTRVFPPALTNGGDVGAGGNGAALPRCEGFERKRGGGEAGTGTGTGRGTGTGTGTGTGPEPSGQRQRG